MSEFAEGAQDPRTYLEGVPSLEVELFASATSEESSMCSSPCHRAASWHLVWLRQPLLSRAAQLLPPTVAVDGREQHEDEE